MVRIEPDPEAELAEDLDLLLFLGKLYTKRTSLNSLIKKKNVLENHFLKPGKVIPKHERKYQP